MVQRYLAILALPILMISGCATGRAGAGWPEPIPLGSDLPAYRPPVRPPDRPDPGNEWNDPTGTLSLRQVLELALQRSPELASFGWEVRALDAAALQASLPANPEIEAELEEFGGTGATRGLSTAVGTVGISQTFLGPGTLILRGRSARLERDLAGWDYEAARADVLTLATQRYIDVLAGQRRVDVVRRLAEVAEKSHETVSLQVEAGKVSPVELTRAQVEMSLARIERERTVRDLLAARQRLAETWGGETAVYDEVSGDLESVEPIPSILDLGDLVTQNPDVARWSVEMEHRRAEVELARSEAFPEVSLRGGVQHFNESRDTAAVIGLSLPLPVFDLNQGNIRQARFREAKGVAEERAAVARASTALEGAYQDLASAHTEVISLQRDVMPGATVAYDAAFEAYRQGKLSFLDLLDAQRTLSRVQSQYIDALATYHSSVAEVERLVGQALPSVTDSDGGSQRGDES